MAENSASDTGSERRSQPARSRSATALGLLLLPCAVLAASGEEIYQTRCSLCHDSGSGQAPRISDREEWSTRLARGRDALVQSAIRGVPNSAMMARGEAVTSTVPGVRTIVNDLIPASLFEWD